MRSGSSGRVSGSGGVTPSSSSGIVPGSPGSGSGCSRTWSGSRIEIATFLDFEVSAPYPRVRFEERGFAPRTLRRRRGSPASLASAPDLIWKRSAKP